MPDRMLMNETQITAGSEVLVLENKQNRVYRARLADGTTVALKRTLYGGEAFYEASKLSNEFTLLAKLEHPAIPKAYGLVQGARELTLILEWIEGNTLKTEARKGLRIERFFDIALRLTDALQYVHNAGIVHKDINPANILLAADGGVKLIDFGISTAIHNEQEAYQAPELLEGTLIYISPEQSGRTSFSITTASDIYSLGIVFYEMLAGKPPFESNDPLEVIHFHLSRTPAPLHTVNPQLPAGISAVVSKMLEKNPDDRYLSMEGIAADLRQLKGLVVTGADTVGFVPGQNDNKRRFRLTQRLYGRDQETERLIKHYDDLGKTGSSLVLVSGYSGVGKSALVKQLLQPILANKGTFISGKYDQFKQKTPYYAFIEAFSDHIKSILSEAEDKVAFWRQKLSLILGENASLITEVIPYLERILGKQQAAQKLQPAEQEYRFRSVMLDFVYAFTTPVQPMVIFLDDLQWADLPSLNLIERILLTPANGNVLIIGTYRDNEVDDLHPLTVTVKQLKENEITVHNIDLQPLNETHTTTIVADSFGIKQSEARVLGSLAHSKTKGNPFFINRFLKSVYDDGYVSYKQDHWEVDIAAIESLEYTDNVIDLMTRDLATLPEKTFNLLKLAAVLGNNFDLSRLALIANKSSREVFTILEPALTAGYILPQDKNYRSLLLTSKGLVGDGKDDAEDIVVQFRFLHDRVQQAAYSLFSDKERELTHLNAGRKLLANTPDDKLAESVFDIVGHFSQAHLLINDTAEKVTIARLCLLAGKKSKDSTSYDLAVKFLELAVTLLTAAGWQTHYDLMYETEVDLGEAEYLNNNHEKAGYHFDEVLRYARTRLEKLRVYYIQSSLYLKVGDVTNSLAVGRVAMRLFNISFPENNVAISLATATEMAKYLLLFSTRYKNPEKLFHLPDCTDPEIIMVNQFLIDMATSAYQVNQQLMMLVVFKIIEHYIKYGFTDASGWGFSGFSVVALSALGLSQRGFALWDITTKLHQSTKSPLIKWKLDYTVRCFGTHWRRPLAENLDAILDNIKGCMMNGDPIFTGYAISLYLWKKSATGQNIQKFLQDSVEFLDFMKRNRNGGGLAFSELKVQTMKSYAGMTDSPGGLDDEKFSFESAFQEIRESKNNTSLGYLYCARLLHLCFFGKYKDAVDWAVEGMYNKQFFLGHYMVAEWEFCYGLSMLAIYPNSVDEERKRIRKEMRGVMRWMKLWAKDCPENFEGMYLLLTAEWEAISRKHKEATTHFQAAIKSFNKNGFRHLEAKANYRYSLYQLANNNTKEGVEHLNAAIALYRSWGAAGLCRSLEMQHYQYFSGKNTGSIADTGPHTLQTVSVSLDLSTILKASQTLASQIKLDELLQNLMYIVIENAGAQKGYLLLEKEHALCIMAEGNADAARNRLLPAVPFEDSGLLPVSMIQYCRRTGETVVVTNALRDRHYATDTYVVDNHILSMMCLPLAEKGENIGWLYLENNLMEGVFTSGRLDLLQMLSGQMAISIQNALLYENLEEKVRERTLELQEKQLLLEEEMRRSDKLLLNILPQQTANDLKQFGYSRAVSYSNVHVMFCDMEGFTKRAASMGPEEIVEEIHELFSGMDDIMQQYNIEKIKTIGDAYLCASGLSEQPDETAAIRMIQAARDVFSLLERFNQSKTDKGRPPLRLRIGINSGAVTAGVVGKSKFAYDIWGDTVNTASRMESAGEAGKINISHQTYMQVKDHYNCISRGKLEAKNKGLIEMYFVE